MHFLKKYLISIMILFISSIVFSQEQLNLGDNILEYIKQNPPKFKTIGSQEFQIDEGRIDYYKYKDVTDHSDLKILVINDKHVIGALQFIKGKDRLYFDITGDGILDSEIDFMIVPYWVIAETSFGNIDRNENNLLSILDQAFEQYNSNENPFESGSHLKLVNEIVKAIADSDYPNRDLYYALFSYYLFGKNYPWEAVQAMDYLSRNYYDRFNNFHPLFYLHSTESLIDAGYTEEAKKLAYDLADLRPDFIPGQVYLYQLEGNPEKKQQMLNDLKKKYPDHWIIKNLK
ncbi:MAG: hypothetical protein PF518_17065 [Spirochaetaceae bacterium]|nr:hypothetical protein [Spirochaetaceae bacterium]